MENLDSVEYIDGNFVITNPTEWVWTNVRLLLNDSFTYTLADDAEVKPQQTITIPASAFTNNGESLGPSGRPWIIKVFCDLPSNRRGEFVGSWH